jgi:hypothetical protein
MIDITQEYVPEVASADHWSNTPEYLAEKALQDRSARAGQQMKPFFETDPRTGRQLTTHEATQKAFTVEYVPTGAETLAKVAAIRAEHTQASDDILEQMAKDMLANIEKALEAKDVSSLESDT